LSFEAEQAAGAAASLHLVRLKEVGRDQYCYGDGCYLFHNGLRWPGFLVNGQNLSVTKDGDLNGLSESGRSYGPEIRPGKIPGARGCGTPDQGTLRACTTIRCVWLDENVGHQPRA